MTPIIYAMARILPAIVIGFILYKKNILNADSTHTLSWLVLNFTSPCLIFNAIVSVEATSRSQVYLLLWVGCALYALLMAVAFAAVKILRVPKKSEGVYQCLLIFGNVTFMGFPLVESLYGSEGLFYMALLNIHLNIILFTYGTFQIARCNDAGGFKPKQLINAPFIASVLACIVFLTGIRMPEIILTPMEFLGSMTSPAAMIILGASIGSYNLAGVFNKWRIYVVALLRLLILPLVVYFALKAFVGEGVMTDALTIYTGMPVASAIAMMSIVYRGDTESAAAGVGLTTILGMGTLPVLYFVMSAC